MTTPGAWPWALRATDLQAERLATVAQHAYIRPVQSTIHMRDFFFAFGHICQKSFDWLLVSVGWFPPVLFTCVLAFGAVYWMMAQAKYTRRAIERKEYI